MSAHVRRNDRSAAPVSVEILIVSYNTAALLADCLESIQRHRPPPDTARVLVSVLDNASSDGSAEMVRDRFPDVRLVLSPENVGFARANNRLALQATGDYLLLLNSDTRFTEDVITPLLDAMGSGPDVALAAPRLVYPDGSPQFSSERFPALRYEVARALRGTKAGLLFRTRVEATLARFRRQSETEDRATHRAEFVWATCWMLRRDDVGEHGLFGEDFVTYDEDLDFCRRLEQRGGVALYVASTQLVHIGGASSSTEAKRRMVQSARRRYYRRHASPLQAWAYWLMVTGTERLKRSMTRPVKVRPVA